MECTIRLIFYFFFLIISNSKKVFDPAMAVFCKQSKVFWTLQNIRIISGSKNVHILRTEKYKSILTVCLVVIRKAVLFYTAIASYNYNMTVHFHMIFLNYLMI